MSCQVQAGSLPWAQFTHKLDNPDMENEKWIYQLFLL